MAPLLILIFAFALGHHIGASRERRRARRARGALDLGDAERLSRVRAWKPWESSRSRADHEADVVPREPESEARV